MEDDLNHLKKGYRTRFCHGGGNKIDLQPGQNILKFVEDCFESCSSDLIINSPSCSTSVLKNEKGTSRQRHKSGSTNSVRRACNSAEPSPTSLLKPVSSRGQSCESHLKPATDDYVAASKKPESPVSTSEKNNTLKHMEALCQRPDVLLDSEDNHESVGSPFPVEEAKTCPVVKLRSDNWNTPAAAKSHGEIKNLEEQPGRDEQVEGTKHVTVSSARKKSFSSAVLAAVATRGQRYSASVSPPSPHPVKGQDIETENECEFLIDESGGISSTSWISIPSKKPKNNGSAGPISKSQPSEKKKTQNKKVRNRKVEAKAPTKQKLDHLGVRAFDFEGTSESDSISDSEEKVHTSQTKKSTRMGKTKKDALRQNPPNEKKNTSWKLEAEELMSRSGVKTKPSDEEQCKTRNLLNEDLSVSSSDHQEEQTVSSKMSLRSSKNLQLSSKASSQLVKKKQTAKQKLPEVKVSEKGTASPRKKLKKSVRKNSNKKPQLQREESSDSEPSEEELAREAVELNEVCTTPLHQKLESPMIPKFTKTEKPRNVLHTSESHGGADEGTPVKALQHPMDSVKNPEKKRLSAKSSGKRPKKIPRRTNKALCSSTEDTESQADSDSSVQDMARENQKLPHVKTKSNKRKHNRQHVPQDSFVAEKVPGCESGPVDLHHPDCDIFACSSPEQDNTSSDECEDCNCKLIQLLSEDIARRKIGELVLSGLVHPETQSPKKSKKRRDPPKQKRDKTNTGDIPASWDHTLADTSKPTTVLDPETNEEVHLDCVNTASSNSYFFKDEAIEIYKNLNTSVFATGRLILKPFKEKGHQFVHMDTIAFHIIHGKIIVTLHKTSYCLTTGDFFYVPAGNGYNLRNLLDEESILLYTQLKDR
ncbi:centromere protein C isoform X2 [Malurus melanocephalus]|uniref:centromere protein C isoform X2 n=1 Tax=Malurus melanocephalus TaxID=175006 RepID=UPI0025486B79|nr:centromere protein C isoform X2 [Malurus melanocephalus]